MTSTHRRVRYLSLLDKICQFKDKRKGLRKKFIFVTTPKIIVSSLLGFRQAKARLFIKGVLSSYHFILF